MTIQRIAMVLTAINVFVLAFGLAQFHPSEAQGNAPVLRGRALEIADANN